MTITLAEIGYQLRPYSKGPCWQVWRQGREGEWRPSECYPSTIARGLELIAERALREGPAEEMVEIVSEIRKLRMAIRAAADALSPPQSDAADTNGCR